MLSPRHHRPARSPFWLLLAAWLCANSPQSFTYEIVVWLGNARSFSHQQRLTSEVAFILAGQPAAAVVAIENKAPQPEHPPIPSEVSLKKFDLFVMNSSELLPPQLRLLARNVRVKPLPTAPAREPLAEPPRVG